MSLEAITLQSELNQIEEAKRTLMERVKAFREFIISPRAFDDDAEFESRLSDIQESVVTLAELTVAPSPATELFKGMGMAEAAKTPTEAEAAKQATLIPFLQEGAFSLPKALVSAVAMVGAFLMAEKGLIPPIGVLAVVGAVLAFAFAPQLKQLIQAFMEKRPEEAEEEELTLEEIEKVSELFTEIRRKYVSAYFLIRWQGRPEEPIPEAFEGLGWPKELLNRGEQLRRTLPHEFMSLIGKIVNACERSIWQRKQFIVSAMVQSSMGMIGQR
ncbi:MAG: hypothetical protein QXI60_04275 [Thermofilaceae archaeon]